MARYIDRWPTPKPWDMSWIVAAAIHDHAEDYVPCLECAEYLVALIDRVREHNVNEGASYPPWSLPRHITHARRSGIHIQLDAVDEDDLVWTFEIDADGLRLPLFG